MICHCSPESRARLEGRRDPNYLSWKRSTRAAKELERVEGRYGHVQIDRAPAATRTHVLVSQVAM